MDLSNAKKIEITDKQLFDQYLLKFKPQISELSFTNLFIWRNHYNFLFLELKDHLIIFSKKYLNKKKRPLSDKKHVFYFLPPIGQYPDKIIMELFEKFDNIEIHKVPERIANKIKDNTSSNLNLKIIEDRDNWDYVYSRQDLLSLAGNNYRQKRRWLNKFSSQYNYKFDIINEENIEDTRELQIKWCDIHECQSHEELMEESFAIDEVLNNYFELNVTGAILCVEDRCVGYTLGEMLNENTLVIHIEKAHVDFGGSYQAINNLFLKTCCENAIFVNREQDLGIPGLRKAKESYKPHHMEKKKIII